MLSNVTCSSLGTSICHSSFSFAAVPGYYCRESKCHHCPPGTFGSDGKKCEKCPFGSWAPLSGQDSCHTSFSYAITGLRKAYIPYGVTQIKVHLWEGRVGNYRSLDTKSLSRADGGEGYSSCKINVPMKQEIYIIIAKGGDATGPVSSVGGKSRYYLWRHMPEIFFTVEVDLIVSTTTLNEQIKLSIFAVLHLL